MLFCVLPVLATDLESFEVCPVRNDLFSTNKITLKENEMVFFNSGEDILIITIRAMVCDFEAHLTFHNLSATFGEEPWVTEKTPIEEWYGLDYTLQHTSLTVVIYGSFPGWHTLEMENEGCGQVTDLVFHFGFSARLAVDAKLHPAKCSWRLELPRIRTTYKFNPMSLVYIAIVFVVSVVVRVCCQCLRKMTTPQPTLEVNAMPAVELTTLRTTSDRTEPQEDLPPSFADLQNQA